MEPALDEVLRRELVDFAADTLGRLPAEDVPAALRAVARFAPAKRRRLGAAALAAAVDRDEAFRERLARVLEESTPDLVAAVRAGASTAASDPADVAVVAYLVRPPGWPAVVAEAQERVARERADGRDADGAAREQVAELRAELADLRTRLRGEAARQRAAVAEAAAALEEEAAAARRTVRERTRELRAAERERDALREQLDDERAVAVRQVAAAEAETRRLRARVSELERAVESARRGTKVARDVDDARLWLLVDTLVRAATGVRSELALAAPDLRPADTVTPRVDGGVGSSVLDAAALDRLLALPNVHLVVDGYNVTKTGYGALTLDQQRTRLIGSLAPLAAQSGAEVTVVFDGAERPPAQPVAPRGVRVLFSAVDEIADDVIRRVVAAEPAGRPVAVVTSDQAVVGDVRREGAWSVPSAVLLTRLG